MQQRPMSGIWGGLWGFMEFANRDELNTYVNQRLMLDNAFLPTDLDTFKHTFSHFHLQISPVIVHLSQLPQVVEEEGQSQWFNVQEPLTVGLSAPTQKILATIQRDIALVNA